MKKLAIFLLLFILCFGVYLYTAPPGLVAYRDAGEMVTVSKTLGIAHPPGYPLYSIIGKLSTFFPLGNIAYRVNLVSLIAGALTVSMLFLALSYLVDLPTVVISALLLATGYLHWYLSTVQEMYSLNILFTVLLIYLIFRLWFMVYSLPSLTTNHYPLTIHSYLFFFLFGIALGNRMDILLTLPGFAYLFYRKLKTENFMSLPNHPITQSLITFSFFVIGFSVYLYLPIRSASGPLLDWNHPADLARFWATLSRKTHGGTLDLLSQGYAQGANFLPTIVFYFQCLAREYFYLGLPVGIFGLFHLYKKQRNLAIATFLSWVVSGPVFVYLSNLPPNPHALAILEAHFLLSFIFYLLWIGFGISVLGKYGKIIFLPIIALNFVIHYPQVIKRNNFFVLDYSRNLFSLLEPDSIIVTREDVQIFSLWERQIVRNKRPDLTVIAQGLSASPWYQEEIKRWYPERKVFLTNTKEPDTLNQFFSLNERKIYFSSDSELPSADSAELKFKLNPQGLVFQTRDERFFNPYEFYSLRGKYRYSAHYDFFSPDLVEEYAKGYERLGFKYLKDNNYKEAEKNFLYVLTMKPDFAQVYSTLGYLYFANNRFLEAEKFYTYAVDTYADLYRKAEEYRSFPEVKEAIKSDISGVYNNTGVVYERQNKENEALNTYQKAMEYNSANADAQYNIAVIYWKKNDWGKVISALENVLRINPQHQTARNYLMLAREKLKERQ
ncbi:MAG TPA: hypothetical protein DHV62_02420 [Elusimicrobia bacterium]|jgi:tetratricopeptide (TPR) repeat protein|nr:hypothetical protein [Elusimicrobiota bacterium]